MCHRTLQHCRKYVYCSKILNTLRTLWLFSHLKYNLFHASRSSSWSPPPHPRYCCAAALPARGTSDHPQSQAWDDSQDPLYQDGYGFYRWRHPKTQSGLLKTKTAFIGVSKPRCRDMLTICCIDDNFRLHLCALMTPMTPFQDRHLMK